MGKRKLNLFQSLISRLYVRYVVNPIVREFLDEEADSEEMDHCMKEKDVLNRVGIRTDH